MINYLPSEILKRVARKKAIQNLVTENLTLNKAAVKTLTNMDILAPSKLTEIAIRVINGYKKKRKELLAKGLDKSEATEDALNDKKNMVREIEQASIYQISKDIKYSYRGEYFIWLPSDAENPDPEHQLNYGKTFQIGVDEMPGDRWGCRCGMQILVDETRLDLE